MELAAAKPPTLLRPGLPSLSPSPVHLGITDKNEERRVRASFLSSFSNVALPVTPPFLFQPPLFRLSRDGSFSATITPEIFLRLMQELCFRRFARCFAYLRGGQARTHARGRRRAFTSATCHRGGQSWLEIGGWTALRARERASAVIREMVRNIWVKARTLAEPLPLARHRRPRQERNWQEFVDFEIRSKYRGRLLGASRDLYRRVFHARPNENVASRETRDVARSTFIYFRSTRASVLCAM